MAGILDALTPTTIANYARGAWDGVSFNTWFFKEMKAKGCIVHDVTGDTLSGPIEAGRYLPQTSAPGQDISALFVPKVRHQRWNFSWGEKINALTIDRGLLRRNSGDQALVRLKDTEIPALFRDLLIAQGGLLADILGQYGPGYVGQGLPIYGIPSFLLPTSGSGALNGFNPNTEASTGSAVAVADLEACAVSQTYGGLSLAPNGLTGIDGLQADAWQPVMLNGSSSGWAGASAANDEADVIEVILQHLVDRLSRFGDNDPSQLPNFGLLDKAYYRFLGARKASREQVFVMPSQRSPDTGDYGYEPLKGLYHAGMFWRWEALMGAYTAYSGNMSKLKLQVQPLYKDQENGSPLKVSGEEAGLMETAINFIPERRGYAVSATIPGQLTAEPRYFGCVRRYAAT